MPSNSTRLIAAVLGAGGGRTGRYAATLGKISSSRDSSMTRSSIVSIEEGSCAMIVSAEASAASKLGNSRTASRRAVGIGTTPSHARVTIPSVPSAPVTSHLRSSVPVRGSHARSTL
jgi:hypothetical protein